jgi:hypothetical protein
MRHLGRYTLVLVTLKLTPFFLGEFAKLRKGFISFVIHARLSVRPSAWNSAPNGRIFTKFGIWAFFENLLKIKLR